MSIKARPYLVIILLWIAFSAGLLAIGAHMPDDGLMPDADDALRLVQVRDWLGGQAWFDLHQHRVDPFDGGVAMHWSRLVDLPIAGLIVALRGVFGAAQAEHIAVLAVPLLTFGCILLLVGRIALRLLDFEAMVWACLLTAMAIPIVLQIRPMRIDHHGWQIVLALAALNGLVAAGRAPGTRAPGARPGAWLSGLSLAVSLAISFEGVPLTAAFAAVGAIRWLRDRDPAWLTGFVQALALASAGLFAATRGFGDLATHCDQISPIHIAVFAWGAMGLGVLAWRNPGPAATVAGFGVIGLGAIALLWGGASQCAHGAFSDLDPVVRRFWYDYQDEGLPLWRQQAASALQVAVPVILGLLAAVKLALVSDGPARCMWTDYAVVLGAAFAIALAVSRAGATSCALAAIPLGWLLQQWLGASRRSGRLVLRVAALMALPFALQPSLLMAFIPASPAPLEEHAVKSVPRARQSACQLGVAAKFLANFPQGNILAPLDIGPTLLVATPHTVLATGHHRGARAMREVIDAFTGDDATAHAIVRRRHIDYVILCPDIVEAKYFDAAAPDGLSMRLTEGRVPSWLTPIAMPRGLGLLALRVVR